MTDKIERLKKLDTDKLIDVVKNYRQYGYEENLRNSAISLLEERGITTVDTRPVVFHLVLTFFLLFLTLRVLESRRWK